MTSHPAPADVVVRVRDDDDLPALLAILRRSHELHRYPVRASVVRADWLAQPGELFGAVAVHEGRTLLAAAITAASGLDRTPVLLVDPAAAARGFYAGGD